MLRVAKKFSISALTVFLVASTAHAEIEYIWDNSKGFDSAKECQVIGTASSRFRITQHADGLNPFEHVYSENGRHYSYLLDNSLVRIDDPHEKAGNVKINVIGVSPNPKVETRRGFLSWNDQGYFKPQGLKELTGYIIEVHELVVPTLKKTIGDTGENVAGTLWQVARHGDQYVAFRCGAAPYKFYLVFDVFRHDKADPIVRVGVNVDEVTIFKSVQIHAISEAGKATKIKPDIKPEIKVEVQSDVKPAVKSDVKNDIKTNVKTEPATPQSQVLGWVTTLSTKEVTKSEPPPPAQPLPEPKAAVEATPPANPHPQASVANAAGEVSFSGPINVSMAASLFGMDTIPQLSHGDWAYRRPFRGLKSEECRTAWKQLRQQKVKMQAVGVTLETLINKGKAMGLSPAHLKKTLGVFLANQDHIPDQQYISVIDFGKRADQKRMFIVDLKEGHIFSYPVAAGKGSDPDGDGYSTIFTNDIGTHTSSLGCYMVAGDFGGKHGPSIMLHGIEPTNDYACERTVEFHQEGYVGGLPGRSWGCFAVRPGDRKEIYPKVRSGLICAYKDGKFETVAVNRESHGRSSRHRRH